MNGDTLKHLGLLAIAVALLFPMAGCVGPGMGKAASNEAHAVIVVATSAPPVGLYRVVLQDIDGKRPGGAGARNVPPHISLMVVDRFFDVSDARRQFEVAPGEHTIGLTAVVDWNQAQMFAPSSPHADKDAGRLKLTLQEGKRYYVAAKVEDIKPDRWQAVVYKVEDIEDYRDPEG